MSEVKEAGDIIEDTLVYISEKKYQMVALGIESARFGRRLKSLFLSMVNYTTSVAKVDRCMKCSLTLTAWYFILYFFM